MNAIALEYSITKLSAHGYKLAVQTSYQDDQAADAAVFAIEVLPRVEQMERQPQVRFSHICDLAQMQQYGTEYTRQQPYFRTDSVQLIVHSRAQVQHILEQFKRRLKHLMRQYLAYQNQAPEQQATILIEP